MMVEAASIITFAVFCLAALVAAYVASEKSAAQSPEIEPVDSQAFHNLLGLNPAEVDGLRGAVVAELRMEFVLAHRDYLGRIYRNAVRIQRIANNVLQRSGDGQERELAQELIQKATWVRLQSLALLAGTYIRFTNTSSTSYALKGYSTLRARAAAIH